jgi:hypothetical protein
LLALATQHDLEVHQLDVKMTFLCGYLDEKIYMNIPKGLSTSTNTHLVCKFTKSLYGLKQSSRAWYQFFDNFLIPQGFTRLQFVVNIYVKRQFCNGFTILIVYINDYIIVND